MKSDTPDMERYLVLSAHDYRSPRKAGMHFIADELAKKGETRFFSLRYSFLSRFKRDPRCSIDSEANKIGVHEGVECYLWKTLIHPFNTRRKWLRPLENMFFYWYGRGWNKVLRQWIKESTVIMIESGVSPVFFDLIKSLNPKAKIIYRASDALETIDVADYIHRTFARTAGQMDTVVVISKALAESIPSTHNVAYVSQGIDHSIQEKADPSPYGKGLHAVSLGSMLFDPSFFVIASQQFPQIHFHVIGCGHDRHPDYGDNVTVYPEMPFDQTVPYIKHANLGIAPYSRINLPVYLRDTSLKLTQYAFFGLPAICPHFIAADYPNRFGYKIGDRDSIVAAINKALEPAAPASKRSVFSWQDVTDRMLNPELFPDTKV